MVTFEAGSRLSLLGESVFLGCRSLRSIWLPASLRQFGGLAMAGLTPRGIRADGGSLRASGAFLVDLNE
jgi:hypothetical protein